MHYEGTNNNNNNVLLNQDNYTIISYMGKGPRLRGTKQEPTLIKWRFRLERMVYQVWAQRMPHSIKFALASTVKRVIFKGVLFSNFSKSITPTKITLRNKIT